MPLSKEQESITVGGKSFLWNRLPTTQSVELFQDLAPVILPAVVEVGTCLPLELSGEGKLVMHAFRASDLTPLPDALRKALKELPYSRLMGIAKKALAYTSCGNEGLFSKQDSLDRHVATAFQFYELLFRALALQYGDFSDVLAGLGLRLRGQGASPSEESSTSAGPSSAS